MAVETADAPEPRLLAPCASDPGLALPSADPSSALQLAESFPFMNQEQLLQLLSANSGLPSLLPPFLGSLPLWTGLQQTTQSPAQPQQQQQSLQNQQQQQQLTSQQQQLHQAGLLNQTSPLNILPSISGAQGDFPVNLISLLNPPPPPASHAAGPSVGGVGDAGDKPSLQALLMASLLLSQQQAAAMLPLPGLGQINLDISLQQQQQQQQSPQPQAPFPFPLPDGMPFDKTLVDSVLTGPGLLEALQGLVAAGDGAAAALTAAAAAAGPQSLLLSAPLPPPAFLSLNPALLAAALGPADPLPTQQSPPAHSQVPRPASPRLAPPALRATPVRPQCMVASA